MPTLIYGHVTAPSPSGTMLMASTAYLGINRFLLTHFAQPIAAICWRGSCDDLWQLEQAVGHRGRTQAGPGQARQHRGQVVAPVEAVFELGEVAWHVLGSDRVVGPNDGGLDVAQGGVDPLEGRRAGCSGTGAGLDHRVLALGLGDGAEAGQAIADDLAGRREVPLGKARHRAAGKAGYPMQFQPHRLAVHAGLDSGNEGYLARSTAAALAAAE